MIVLSTFSEPSSVDSQFARIYASYNGRTSASADDCLTLVNSTIDLWCSMTIETYAKMILLYISDAGSASSIQRDTFLLCSLTEQLTSSSFIFELIVYPFKRCSYENTTIV